LAGSEPDVVDRVQEERMKVAANITTRDFFDMVFLQGPIGQGK
jgi:hypothetical protein